MTIRRRALLAAPFLAPGLAAAQEAWPTRPMRFLVPVPAGGSADLQARLVAQRLQERWGYPVVVENRPGANGIVAVQAFLQTPPDGHTVLASQSGPIVINPSLVRNLPYNPQRDLSFASLISVIPMVLIAHPSVPANNLSEFLALTRSLGDRVTMAAASIGSPSHLTIEMLRLVGQGGRVTQVPFTGSAPALTALVAGQVMAMWDAAVSAAPFVREGRMKALAVAHSERLPIVGNTPTTAEQGLPDLVAATWMSLNMHAATPQDRVRKLSAEVDQILREPSLREVMTAQGAIVRGGTPEDYAAFVRSETEKWGRLVRETGATVE
jgi:tripartite-type tricarboxylate transporter receptor subunit TctC